MITFTHLTKKFGRFTAVDDLSFEVPRQHAVALWGPNGAGKTTIIKCLLGLLGYEGQIVVDGLDARKKGREVRRMLGYVPQELSFYDDMSTAEMTRYFARLKKVDSSRSVEVLDQVGLTEHAKKPVGALSGGMKQRLALGLALLADPAILVLDEPTSSLDAETRDQFLNLLTEVNGGGKTIVFTSHHLREIETLADQVLVLREGKIEFSCEAHEMADRLGLRTQIKLRVAPDLMAPALEVLLADGLSARRNGVGIQVEVPAHAKAKPIESLSRADIPVLDFDIQ